MSSLFGLGDFWPNGDFEYDRETKESGWYDRLRAYYKDQPEEEQKRLFDYKGDLGSGSHFYGTFTSSKFHHERGSLKHGVLLGEVEPFELPRSWDTVRTHKSLGSLIKLESKILAVDKPLRDIIVRLEPKVHEFYELPIRMPRGEVYPVRYYIIRVGQYFDAISFQDSWEGSFWYSEANPGTIFLDKSAKAIKGLAFRKSEFGGAHLWRERYRTFQEDLTCFSDELVSEINRAGLRIPKHYKMREV